MADSIDIKKAWEFNDKQSITVHDKKYNIHAAIMQARDIEIVELPINKMYISYSSPCEANLRSFIEHVKLVNDANLEFPIILNEDGFVIDGRHRLSKAIIEGKKTIKSKRFISDPEACFEWV